MPAFIFIRITILLYECLRESRFFLLIYIFSIFFLIEIAFLSIMKSFVQYIVNFCLYTLNFGFMKFKDLGNYEK